MGFNRNQHLQDVLESHRMKHVQTFVDKMTTRRDEIATFLKEQYGSNAYDTFNSGSIAKHTATNIKFDMDVVIPFKHDAFDTLQDMYNDVYDKLYDKYKDEAEEVRKQKVSIGIKFKKEDGDDKAVEIDVVPGRETSDDSYNDNSDLNIYIRKATWGQEDGGYMKTNIEKQRDHIKGKTNERKTIRLLKIWKKHHDKSYKSFAIELMVIKSFVDYDGGNGLWERLEHAMKYIRDNVTDSSFHVYDPGNGNNDVIAAMSNVDRVALKTDMATMLTNIESNDSYYLPYYFPINKKFFNSYKEKKEGSPYPTSPKRFGQ